MGSKLIPIKKKKAIMAYVSTHSRKFTAEKFGVAVSTVARLIHNTDRNKVRDKKPPGKEPAICRHFGCGRTLTANEQLYGNMCIDHSKILII